MTRDKAIAVLKQMAHVEERTIKFAASLTDRTEASERFVALKLAIKDMQGAGR